MCLCVSKKNHTGNCCYQLSAINYQLSTINYLFQNMSMLIQNIQQTLGELNGVMGQLDEEQFSRSLPIFSGSTIGMHARHIVEFYQCLLEQSADNQRVNYDNRSRDLLLQTNLDYFTETVESIISTLDTVGEKQLKYPLSIMSDEDDETMISSLAVNCNTIWSIQFTTLH